MYAIPKHLIPFALELVAYPIIQVIGFSEFENGIPPNGCLYIKKGAFNLLVYLLLWAPTVRLTHSRTNAFLWSDLWLL